MAALKILFSNLGYCRGISGRLAEHVLYAYRHFYCSPRIQQQALGLLNKLIANEKPDLCCLVEIDRGSLGTARFNQLQMLVNETYPFFEIENKYARGSFLRSFAMTSGKSNAFIAKKKYPFEKMYFTRGVKRLIYKITVEPNLTLFFAHFSLKKSIRMRQLVEMRDLAQKAPGDCILLGDFNVLTGLQEIAPILDEGRLVLLNRDDQPTFFFHRHKRILDLCLVSRGIENRCRLNILPQPFSDHAALVLEVDA